MGCEEPAPASAREYLAAVEARDPARCQAITEPDLAGQCTSLTARELAQSGDVQGALTACRGMPVGSWRDECHFMVADVSRLEGNAAQVACSEAGMYRTQCVGHAIAREVSAVLNASAPGEEAQTLEALDVVVRRYIPGRERHTRVRQLMAGHIGARQLDAPFSLALCGTAPEMICQEAYVERVRSTERAAGRTDGSWRRACGSHVSLERAVSLGLPAWEPDFAGLSRGAWDQLCRR